MRAKLWLKCSQSYKKIWKNAEQPDKSPLGKTSQSNQRKLTRADRYAWDIEMVKLFID